MKKVEIFDTTLRDGAQSAEIAFSLKDKLNTLYLLDKIGVSFAEGGNPGAMVSDLNFFQYIKDNNITFNSLKLVAFMSTCKEGGDPRQDEKINKTLDCCGEYVSIVGKASLYHVENVLKTTREENLRMISETLDYVSSKGKKIIFYAEHYFDGCKYNRGYSVDVIKTAFEHNAEYVVLCDTNGGSMPFEVGIEFDLLKEYADRLGIHCHNDCGLAVANSIEAVRNGACQVHGTFCGIGERCGNADLCVLIPDLQLKLGYDIITRSQMASLRSISREIAEIANINFDERTPYVGGFAFSHKAGMHIDGFLKTKDSFQHIDPDVVGNNEKLLLSQQSGRSAVVDKLSALYPDVKKDSKEVEELLNLIKHNEDYGYQYDNSDGSLLLLMLDVLGKRKPFFELLDFKIVLNDPTKVENINACLLKLKVDDTAELVAAEGIGPINSMDAALRKSLEMFYPVLSDVRLVDYKVRVIDSVDATAAKVRVIIESTDGVSSWRTIGVSRDIIEASWIALCDSFEYKLSLLEGLL